MQAASEKYLVDVYNRLMSSARRMAKRHPAAVDLAADTYTLWLKRESKYDNPKTVAAFLEKEVAASIWGKTQRHKRARAAVGIFDLYEVCEGVAPVDVDADCPDDDEELRAWGNRFDGVEKADARREVLAAAKPWMRDLAKLLSSGWTLDMLSEALRCKSGAIRSWVNGVSPAELFRDKLITLAEMPPIRVVRPKERRRVAVRARQVRPPRRKSPPSPIPCLVDVVHDLRALGWSDRQLAKRISCDTSTISRWSAGQRCSRKSAAEVVKVHAKAEPPALVKRKYAYGRPPAGLTAAQVDDIKRLSRQLSQRELSRRFKVNRVVIAKLLGERVGRQAGECNRCAKLNMGQVEALRSEYVPYKTPMRVLAEKYGLSENSVIEIIKGRRYK